MIISAKDAANHSSQTALTLFLDSINPQITISSPQSGSVTNKDKITISGSIEDAYPHQVTLSGGGAGSVQGELIGGNFYFNDILLSEGENAFTVVCQDRAGNSGQADVNVIRDSQPPQLTVLQPVNGAVLPVRSVPVKGTASDTNLKEARVNDFVCPLTNNQFSLLLNLVEGANMIEISASDLAGNLKTETLQVTVDSIAPNLNITSPTANAILNTPTVTVSGRVDDIHLTGVTVKVNGQTVPLSNNEFSVEITLSQEGKTKIVVDVTDSVGNQTSQVIPVTRDTVSPSIVRILPGDQTTHVPLSYHVSVELSEPIDETTLNSQDFYLQCNSEPLAGAISLEGNTCLFKASALLPSDAEI
ncbi:MAG: hypothetical protein GTO35_07185, partial [Gammaproteobacteria bacterium]|nr:hypothetical protein [Gammaproteobacteria bacterium]